MTPEQLVKNTIMSWLNAQPQCFVFPVHTVGIYDPIKKIYRRPHKHHVNGVSDIIGIYRGVPLAIEVKSAKGRVSEEQNKFLTRWHDEGGIAIIARSIDDVQTGLGKQWKFT